jgi:hypothetical protein
MAKEFMIRVTLEVDPQFVADVEYPHISIINHAESFELGMDPIPGQTGPKGFPLYTLLGFRTEIRKFLKTCFKADSKAIRAYLKDAVQVSGDEWDKIWQADVDARFPPKQI